jgi:hypothetical protein
MCCATLNTLAVFYETTISLEILSGTVLCIIVLKMSSLDAGYLAISLHHVGTKGERKYSSLILDSAPDVVCVQHHAPAMFNPEQAPPPPVHIG